MKRGFLAICFCGFSALTPAQGGDSLLAVEAERATLEAESSKAEALCYERFAVNACLSEVAAQRRAQAAVLRKRELALRDAQRAERTREQLQRLEEKQAGEVQRTQEAQGKQASSPPAEPKVAPVPAKAGAPSAEKSTPITPEQAAANRAAFEAKQAEAALRKAEIEKRLLEKKDRAEPLPARP
jgi:colicin import membrane protein